MNRKHTYILLSAAAALIAALPLQSFPSLTAHIHNASVIAWESDGTKDGNSAHNHRTNRDFGGFLEGRAPYTASACWDNRTYRSDTSGKFDAGHCFINETAAGTRPLYYFDGANWPSIAQTRVRQAFASWGGILSDSANRPMGLEFEETTSAAAADITVVWVNNSGSGGGGAWDRSIRQLQFDSSMNWYFEVNPNVGQPGGIQNDQWHFFSVALHEVGHVAGLSHTSHAPTVMTPSVGEPPNVPGRRYFTVADADAVDGMRDLYSQSQAPPPPPPPPQNTYCSAMFQGCPPGCMESPYLMTWDSPFATDYEVQWLQSGFWWPFYSGPQTSANASTGTQHAEFFRVRGVNVSGVAPWCTIVLHVQCSDMQDPW